jgi:hypothetical protein
VIPTWKVRLLFLLVLLLYPVQIVRMMNGLLKLCVALFGFLIVHGANAESTVRIQFLKPENYTEVSFRS